MNSWSTCLSTFIEVVTGALLGRLAEDLLIAIVVTNGQTTILPSKNVFAWWSYLGCATAAKEHYFCQESFAFG